MSTKPQTEDDFKKILKNLFSEKGKTTAPKEKFRAKVEQLQAIALEEELVQIKAAFVESEQQRQLLHSEMETSKPMLQELQSQCALLHEERKEKEKNLQESRESYNKQSERWAQEKALLEKKQEKLQKALLEAHEERELLQGNYEKLERAFKQNQRLFREQSEQQFAEMHLMQERMVVLEDQLQQSDLIKVRKEYEAILTEKENIITLFQKEIRELNKQVEGSEVEVRKAQLHLAKKVKESALLQEVAQKQKEQLLEEQKRVAKERELRIELEKSIEQYQQNEDALKSFTKQCNKESEAVIRQFQEHSVKLQKEMEKQQAKLGELEKYQEGYEKLLAILNGLKGHDGR
jgi:hypothetical protein